MTTRRMPRTDPATEAPAFPQSTRRSAIEEREMFGDYTSGDLISIFAMQGFAGLSPVQRLLLMALGLAIIFGQMGVINMAHGEFMATRRLHGLSLLACLPDLRARPDAAVYFLVAIVRRVHRGRSRSATGGMGMIRFSINVRSTRCWRPGA